MKQTALLLIASTTLMLPVLQAGTARFDCGGPGGTFGPNLYLPDQIYTLANGAGAVGGTEQTLLLNDNGQVIENTPYTALFNSTREGVTAYQFDVPNGLYLLTLQFNEMVANGPNLRQFSVIAENKTLLQNLDLYALYGRNYAVTYQFAVQVKDGQLDVTFPAAIGQSTIAGISVQPIAADTTPPAVPAQVTGLGGYYRNIISWPDNIEPDLAGYLVAKSAAFAGPFSLLNTAPMPVSRYFDDAVTTGQTSYYAVAAVDVFGNVSKFSNVVAADPIDSTKSTLPVYQLSISDANYSILQANPNSGYVDADFTGDSLLYPGIGVKYRGTSSLLNEKKSWKVNFNKGDPFEGKDKLDLKGLGADVTLLTECLSSAQIAETSALVGTCSFAHHEVNGQFMGVFSHVEEIDSDFLTENNLDPNGKLFESNDPDYGNFQILSDYSVGWQDQSADADGFATLSQLCDTINNTSDADFPSVISSVVNVDSYLDYYASIMLTADWDHVSHNFLVYLNPADGVWDLVAKDFDQSFKYYNLPINYGTAKYPEPTGLDNILTNRLLDVPLFRQQYVNKMNALLETGFTTTLLASRVKTMHTEIEFDTVRDIYKRYREMNTAFLQSPIQLNAFVSLRIAALPSQLASYAPGIVQQVVINEVLSDNVNGITDNAGNHSPWLEIYNPGSGSFDLSGFYLTNNPAVPAMWSFPQGSTVASGGHLLVWLDNQPAAGEIHASFTINPQGQAIALFKPGKSLNTLVDAIAYRPQMPDVSYARTTDGAPLWGPQTTPTPGAPNIAGKR